MSSDTREQFGRYRVLDQIGAGAMGAVFRARDERLQRDVAVKAIHTVGVGDFQREVFESRFNNEARALAALSHPHIIPIFDMGIEKGVPYLVMELVSGRSLAARLEVDGTLSAAEARAMVVQLAGALTTAHGQQILHRDVKPANILESDSGTWKLADFGIAHTPDSTLTLTGQFLGSPAYAAPEALQRGEFSPASDIYGLCATLYDSLTGAPPFGDRGLLTEGALTGDREAHDIRSSRPDLPADLAVVIMRGLLRDPSSRIGGPELIESLSIRAPSAAAATVASWPDRSPRRRWVVPAVLAGVLLVGISIGVYSGDESPHPASGSPSAVEPGGFDTEHQDPPVADTLGSAPIARTAGAEKRWRKAREKVDKGDLRGAAKELRRIVSENPSDHEARSLLSWAEKQNAGREWRRGHGKRGKKKKKKKNERHKWED